MCLICSLACPITRVAHGLNSMAVYLNGASQWLVERVASWLFVTIGARFAMKQRLLSMRGRVDLLLLAQLSIYAILPHASSFPSLASICMLYCSCRPPIRVHMSALLQGLLPEARCCLGILLQLSCWRLPRPRAWWAAHRESHARLFPAGQTAVPLHATPASSGRQLRGSTLYPTAQVLIRLWHGQEPRAGPQATKGGLCCWAEHRPSSESGAAAGRSLSQMC